MSLVFDPLDGGNRLAVDEVQEFDAVHECLVLLGDGCFFGFLLGLEVGGGGEGLAGGGICGDEGVNGLVEGIQVFQDSFFFLVELGEGVACRLGEGCFFVVLLFGFLREFFQAVFFFFEGICRAAAVEFCAPDVAVVLGAQGLRALGLGHRGFVFYATGK